MTNKEYKEAIKQYEATNDEKYLYDSNGKFFGCSYCNSYFGLDKESCAIPKCARCCHHAEESRFTMLE